MDRRRQIVAVGIQHCDAFTCARRLASPVVGQCAAVGHRSFVARRRRLAMIT